MNNQKRPFKEVSVVATHVQRGHDRVNPPFTITQRGHFILGIKCPRTYPSALGILLSLDFFSAISRLPITFYYFLILPISDRHLLTFLQFYRYVLLLQRAHHVSCQPLRVVMVPRTILLQGLRTGVVTLYVLLSEVLHLAD